MSRKFTKIISRLLLVFYISFTFLHKFYRIVLCRFFQKQIQKQNLKPKKLYKKFATNIIIRKIQKNDNKQLALLIRAIFDEFDAPKENSVYSDSETDSLFELFNKNKKSEYFVAEQNGKILGGCGYFPTAELPEDCAEIVKFYLRPEARGMKIGSKLFIFA